MPITDIDEYWSKPPKPENGLPEDGEYYARAGQGEIKNVHEGASEFLEIPLTVEEGEYAGSEVKVALFYVLRGEWKEPTLERIKKIRDQVDSRLAKVKFLPSLESMLTLLNGRKAKLEQRTGKDGKTYLNILEVYAPDLAPPMAAGDIPF